jgi:hypothetical protein
MHVVNKQCTEQGDRKGRGEKEERRKKSKIVNL